MISEGFPLMRRMWPAPFTYLPFCFCCRKRVGAEEGGANRMELRQPVFPDIDQDFVAFCMPSMLLLWAEEGAGAVERNGSHDTTQDFVTSRVPSTLFLRPGGELASIRVESKRKIALGTAWRLRCPPLS